MSFNVGIFVNFFVATIMSIIDSIADYYACAKMCMVPPPPVHAVNRGIAVEGFMTMMAGPYGAGHATTTYG
jgi:nucleobase transporter 1/2